MGYNNKKITKATSIVAGLGLAAIIPAFAVTAGLTNSASATGVSGAVRLNTEVATALAMKIASPNDTNPDCMVQSGVTYGEANRYATSNGAEGSKQVDTFDGTVGGADELNSNTSCATLTMNPNAYDSTYSDITIYTNSPTGYSLTVRSADNTSPNLVKTNNDGTTDPNEYIPAGTLTESNGNTPGGQNKWAIKSDNGLLDTWTPVATTDTTVRSYDQETSGGSTTRVTYGISTGNNPTGKYATTLTYTATMFDGENTSIPSADISAGTDTYKVDGVIGGTIKVPYNETRAISISPAPGHYLTNITCTNPYTCTDSNGDPLAIPENNTNPVTVYITNSSKTEAGTVTISTTAIEYPVTVSGDPDNDASSLNTSTSNLSIPYGSYRTVTVAPTTGYYLDSVNCPDGYSCTATTTTGALNNKDNTGSSSPLVLGNNAYATGEGTSTESPVQTGEGVTYAQDVKVKNDNATKGGALTFATKPSNFAVSINADANLTTTTSTSGSSETISSLSIPYGHSKRFTVAPTEGHYLASITCPAGYACTDTEGNPIATGTTATAPQTIQVSNTRTTDGGTLTLTSGTSEYTVSLTNSHTSTTSTGTTPTAISSINVPYGSSATLTLTPSAGYYLSSYTCPTGYTCTKSDDTTIETGTTATSAQTIKITNNNTTTGGSMSFTGTISKYEVAITPSLNATTSTNLLSIPYGGSKTFTITPATGYYLTSLTCSSGYTCSTPTYGSASNPSAASRGTQTITVTNNSTTSTGAISFTLDNKYRISYSKTNIANPSASYTDVAYGGSTTVTVTPASGYYLSGFSGCPSGWTCSGVSTGKNYTSAQTLTLKNNSSVNTGTITLTGTLAQEYMQGFSCSSLSSGVTKTLRDSRDNNDYTVAKLKDGKCWMTSNLRLKGYTLKPADSNVASNWNLPSAADGTNYDAAYVFDTGNTDYGVYYSWYAATAGQGTSSKSSGDVSASVCPKGWRLPTSTEFNIMYNRYGSSASLRATSAGQPAFVLSGYRFGSSTNGQGSNGNYWSSTANNSNIAYNLYLDSSNVNPQGYSTKYRGFSVRCVASS